DHLDSGMPTLVVHCVALRIGIVGCVSWLAGAHNNRSNPEKLPQLSGILARSLGLSSFSDVNFIDIGLRRLVRERPTQTKVGCLPSKADAQILFTGGKTKSAFFDEVASYKNKKRPKSGQAQPGNTCPAEDGEATGGTLIGI